MAVVAAGFFDVVLADAEEDVVLLAEALVDGLVVVFGEAGVDVVVVVWAGGETMMIGGRGIWTLTGGGAGGVGAVEVTVTVAVLVGAGIPSGATTGGSTAVRVGGRTAADGAGTWALDDELFAIGEAPPLPTTRPGFAPVTVDSSATGRCSADSPHPARVTATMTMPSAAMDRAARGIWKFLICAVLLCF
ncbi:hypothetical protein [Tsukamurella spumae]|uniref:Uncharacterized protein n=1 Tax=Tsukamurella spumae TaxID=44753 RepID=A0A846X2I7_9ACTN|nr:hypothetical protein [Tsukamurella spumae]NKY19534.1 hypothetical protein [Tsukamurella spumae]